ncbi:LuxR C-terminal-related transcriptional regulator [Zymobacter palmae]|uniref:DNA-binding HTHdomain-containing proteins n=1 Tax=Zymobacter palmae TaxID=33074 RepID=A0A348HCV4_9GAMM|nr:LuxR C-terminal-related transcriptional regulator [Zymobacter palmae]BBG29456.1 DNA-binding HTHdomain-containing proteins [Zymobacter palmae]
MNTLQIDLFTGLNDADSMQDVLDVALKVIKPMGFDYCGWQSQLPLPLTRPRLASLTTVEDEVDSKISSGAYLDSPLIRHCSSTTTPLLWKGTTDDETFLQDPALMEEYYSFNHRGGWAQSVFGRVGTFSLFHADSINTFTRQDLQNSSRDMQWVAMAVLGRMNQIRERSDIKLSLREQEILRWTGDGKTVEQISSILSISASTINFHLRNAMMKLDAPNKTAAVVRAIFLGLLY